MSTLTPREFGDRLASADAHIERMNGFVAEKFQRFPNLHTISLELGASFFVQFGVTLTWNRGGSGNVTDR